MELLSALLDAPPSSILGLPSSSCLLPSAYFSFSRWSSTDPFAVPPRSTPRSQAPLPTAKAVRSVSPS